jgi:ribosomal protein S18 acetylase RimI-like enzyme
LRASTATTIQPSEAASRLIVIETIISQNLPLFKEVRLRALQEAPYAFGSTYASESAFTDSQWAARLDRWNGVRGVGFIALDGGSSCGIAGTLLDEKDPQRANLVSMWTAPSHRRTGVGRLLVDQVVEWVGGRNVSTLLLMVTSNNAGAIRFYEKLGFIRTGRTEPYPNDPAVTEYEMSRPIP